MRIRSIRVKGFRGIPHAMTLNFSNSEKATPLSCLLVGENGSGKSTFADALEFCITGRYPRFANEPRQQSLERLRNFAATDGVTEVEVVFSDGSTFKRSVGISGRSLESIPESPHPAFRGSGLALRREEIISFLRSTPKARHGVFAEFMRSAAATVEIPAEYSVAISKAESLRSDRITSRDQAAKVLAKSARASFGNLHSKLHDVQSFNSWFISRGYSRKQDERRGATLSAAQESIYAQANVVRRAISGVRKANDEVIKAKKNAANAPLFSLLANVAESLTESFKKISPTAESVQSVNLDLAPQSSEITLKATLANGVIVRAESYFSEANLDLLALLLFLSLMKFASSHGQPKVMVLDDVLQSVDSSIRVKVARYLLEEFGDWQFLVTFHDRLWKEQFSAVFSAKHQFVEREIHDWGFSSGPRIVEARRDASGVLRDCLTGDDPRLICGNAGYLLEVLSDWMSKSLQTSVTRRHGDKYTLGDTWPGVAKKLRSLGLRNEVDRVDGYMWLRNIHGAHYNEWATGLSIVDARHFGDSVLELWERVWCESCRQTLGKHGNVFHCNCGLISSPAG
ncbi:AAA family ATPase [Streptomyces sp. NPDC094031]|uniref:AAA family ATPase n=1 Tax=Streptomyces sp. NPDC094031 TaxID=3155307 RepID=UPI00331BAA49